MQKSTKIMVIALIVSIIGSGYFIGHSIFSIKKEIRELQAPRFVVSKEPPKIAATLIKTFPYLNMWGPDVIFYWSCVIYDQAQKKNMDWALICAKIHCESGFNPLAESNMHAKGMAQTLDSTGAFLSRKMGIIYVPSLTPYNDIASMLMGIEYLHMGLVQEHNNESNGLKCYYAGGGWRKNANQKAIEEYSKNVLTEANRLRDNYSRINLHEPDTIPR